MQSVNIPCYPNPHHRLGQETPADHQDEGPTVTRNRCSSWWFVTHRQRGLKNSCMVLITTDSLLTGCGDIVRTWARQDFICHRDFCNGVLLILDRLWGSNGTCRVSTCPQDASCSLTYGSMMGAASETSCPANILKWQVVLDGEVLTLLERSSLLQTTDFLRWVYYPCVSGTC